MKNYPILLSQTSFIIYFLFITPVYAHTFVASGAGLWEGVFHPVIGIDHFVAMFAVGLWASQIGGKAIWYIPLTFVVMMIIGSVLGISGVFFSDIELGIAVSVVLLGYLILLSIHLPTIISMGLVSLFALLHGHAHGTELPQMASPIFYSLGFVFSTISIHFLGLGVGSLAQKKVLETPILIRAGGGVITIFGLILLINHIF